MNAIAEAFKNPKPTSPFLTGMLSIFDFSGKNAAAELKSICFKSAEESIRDDWNEVGECFKSAIGEYEKQHAGKEQCKSA